MTSLTSLIERIEAATGPDRILDIDVFREIGAPLPTEFMERKIELEWDEIDLCFVMRLDGMRIRYEPPYYTDSLDAALALVPDERGRPAAMHIQRTRNLGCCAVVWIDSEFNRSVRGDARSLPLALLAAILRARQAAQSGQAQTEARG